MTRKSRRRRRRGHPQNLTNISCGEDGESGNDQQSQTESGAVNTGRAEYQSLVTYRANDTSGAVKWLPGSNEFLEESEKAIRRGCTCSECAITSRTTTDEGRIQAEVARWGQSVTPAGIVSAREVATGSTLERPLTAWITGAQGKVASMRSRAVCDIVTLKACVAESTYGSAVTNSAAGREGRAQNTLANKGHRETPSIVNARDAVTEAAVATVSSTNPVVSMVALEHYDGEMPSITERDVIMASLSGCDIIMASLSESDVTMASLSESDVIMTSLSESDVTMVSVTDSDVTMRSVSETDTAVMPVRAPPMCPSCHSAMGLKFCCVPNVGSA